MKIANPSVPTWGQTIFQGAPQKAKFEDSWPSEAVRCYFGVHSFLGRMFFWLVVCNCGVCIINVCLKDIQPFYSDLIL